MALSAVISIFPVSPISAPEYILAVVVFMLFPALRIISPPLPLSPSPCLRVSFSGGWEAEIILLFSVRLISPPAVILILPPSPSAKE